MSLLRRTLFASVLLCAWDTGLAAAPAQPLVEPEPVAVPAGLDQAKVAKAIKLALLGRKWVITKEQPGYIEGTLTARKHVLTVGLTYGRNEVTLKYVDSAELNYREDGGTRYIHKKYTNWTHNVMSDLKARFLEEQL